MDYVPSTRFGLSHGGWSSACEVRILSLHDFKLALLRSFRYQGDMNRSKRDQAVRVFMSKDKARVMLMSLKCGGKCYKLFDCLLFMKQCASQVLDST